MYPAVGPFSWGGGGGWGRGYVDLYKSNVKYVYPSSEADGCSILAVSLENLSLTANRTSLSVSVRVRSNAKIVRA